MFLLHFLFGICEIVELTVICEKLMQEDSLKTTEFLIRHVLKEYNESFAKTGVEFHLKSLLDFNGVSKIQKFAAFSYLVGDNDLIKRESALTDVSSNLIVLFSSVDRHVPELKVFSPCAGRYYSNIGDARISEEMFTIILKAIKGWIEGTFHVNLPNVLNSDRKRSFLKLNHKILEDIKQCKTEKQHSNSNNYSKYEGIKRENEEINEDIDGYYENSTDSRRIKSSESNDEVGGVEHLVNYKPLVFNRQSNKDRAKVKFVNVTEKQEVSEPVDYAEGKSDKTRTTDLVDISEPTMPQTNPARFTASRGSYSYIVDQNAISKVDNKRILTRKFKLPSRKPS